MSGAAAGLDFASAGVPVAALMTIASVGADATRGDAEVAAAEVGDAGVGDAGVTSGDVRGADVAGADVGDTGADVAGRPPESAVFAGPAARVGHPASAAPAVIARPRTAP